MSEVKKTQPRKWTPEEEAELLAKGIVPNRSEGACHIRKRMIALRMTNEGKSLDDVMKITGITEEEIEDQRKIEDKKLKKKPVIVDSELNKITSEYLSKVIGLVVKATIEEMKNQ